MAGRLAAHHQGRWKCRGGGHWCGDGHGGGHGDGHGDGHGPGGPGVRRIRLRCPGPRRRRPGRRPERRRRGRNRRWAGAGSGADLAAAAARAVTRIEGATAGRGLAVGVLEADASDRRTAQATRPQKAVCARGWLTGLTGSRSRRNPPTPPRTSSPAAAHGATCRTRHMSGENGRPRGGSVELAALVGLGGSVAPLDGPVGIRLPPWPAKCYQIAAPITAIMRTQKRRKTGAAKGERGRRARAGPGLGIAASSSGSAATLSARIPSAAGPPRRPRLVPLIREPLIRGRPSRQQELQCRWRTASTAREGPADESPAR